MKTSFLFKLSFCLLLVSLMSISLPKAASTNPSTPAPTETVNQQSSATSFFHKLKEARKSRQLKRQSIWQQVKEGRASASWGKYFFTVLIGLLAMAGFVLLAVFLAWGVSTAVVQIIGLLIPLLILVGMIILLVRMAKKDKQLKEAPAN